MRMKLLSLLLAFAALTALVIPAFAASSRISDDEAIGSRVLVNDASGMEDLQHYAMEVSGVDGLVFMQVFEINGELFVAVSPATPNLSAMLSAIENDTAQITSMRRVTQAEYDAGKLNDAPEDVVSRTLVVYFSASNNTKTVAQYISDELNADLFEITPVNPYTSADLNWTNPDSRVNDEHNNPALRNIALVSDSVENWDSYDTVLIGYPIWWGIAAWPTDSFVRANNFTGKTVIPFCTSTSSGLGQSGELLAQLAGTGNWQEGHRFRSSASQAEVQAWVRSLNLLPVSNATGQFAEN